MNTKEKDELIKAIWKVHTTLWLQNSIETVGNDDELGLSDDSEVETQ